MGSREDWESGYYIHGEPVCRSGKWERHDTWYGNDGVIRKNHVWANSADDDSNIYRGKCVYRCTSCYLNVLHTEEFHNSQSSMI